MTDTGRTPKMLPQTTKSQETHEETEDSSIDIPECFVIMPISTQDGYSEGHFTHIYRDIIAPACRMAGYKPDRADEKLGTNMIHHEIIKQLLNAPMAICDLSSRNPNVMFELGLRQAFDKPVVIIQDETTPHIFDTSVLRSITYRKGRIYNEVVEAQTVIAESIKATAEQYKNGTSINSLIKLLQIEKAVFDQPAPENSERAAIQILQGQIESLSNELSRFIRHSQNVRYEDSRSASADNLTRVRNLNSIRKNNEKRDLIKENKNHSLNDLHREIERRAKVIVKTWDSGKISDFSKSLSKTEEEIFSYFVDSESGDNYLDVASIFIEMPKDLLMRRSSDILMRIINPES